MKTKGPKKTLASEKAIAQAVESIEKAFGKGTILKLGPQTAEEAEFLEKKLAKQIQQAEDSKLLMNILYEEKPFHAPGAPSMEELKKLYGEPLTFQDHFQKEQDKLLAALKIPKDILLGIDPAQKVDWSQQFILSDPPESWSSNKLDLNEKKWFPDPGAISISAKVVKTGESISPDAFTKEVFHSLRQKVQKWWQPKGMTQLAIKRFLDRHIPICCPYIRDQDVASEEALSEYLQAVYHHHFGTQLDPEAPEVFEVTLNGLTEQEAKEVLSKYSKSKSGKAVLQSTKQLKEIGTNSKAIIAWPFESSSMAVNGQPLLYKTQLNEDGTLSCNCMGWTRGSAKSTEGRFCKHTRAVEAQFPVATLYKKWKKGEPLGDDFVESSPETVSGKPSFAPQFTAKRIVEI